MFGEKVGDLIESKRIIIGFNHSCFCLLMVWKTKNTCGSLLMFIGRASLAREDEAGGSWGQEVHILHVNI